MTPEEKLIETRECMKILPDLMGGTALELRQAELLETKDAQIAELVKGLERNKATFQRYAELHYSKHTDEGRAKGDANHAEVKHIEALIAKHKGGEHE